MAQTKSTLKKLLNKILPNHSKPIEMLLNDDLIEELDRCKINYEKKRNNKKEYYLELLKYAVLHNPKIRDVDMED